MPAPPTRSALTDVRFQTQPLMFRKIALAVEPLLPTAQAQALAADPTATVTSDDGKRWRTLGGWLEDPAGAAVQCRASGLTVQLGAAVGPEITLLPLDDGSPSAELVYTAGGVAQRLGMTALLDVDRRFLKLVLAFGADAAGRRLFDQVVAAMSDPAAQAQVAISYIHHFRVPAPPRTDPTGGRIIDHRIHFDPATVRIIDHRTRIDPNLRFRAVTPATPAPAPPATPSPQRFQLATVLRPGVRVEPATTTATAVSATKFRPEMISAISRRPDMRRVFVDPDPPTGDQPKDTRSTFQRSLEIAAFHRIDEADVFPGLARQEQLGWGQVPGREGKPALHFRDAAEADLFYYLPTAFGLGFHAESDDSNRPPMRAEHYRDATGQYRVKVTLVALPTLPDADREQLRTHLRDVVLRKLVPFVRLEPASGLTAHFIADFTSGSAGDLQTLPAGILFNPLEVDPDDRLVLQFDMQAYDYALFAEMLKKGLRGRVRIEADGVQESIEVRLRLDEVTTNAVRLRQTGGEPAGAPSGSGDATPTATAVHVENLLELPVAISALRANLIDRGSAAGIVFDAEALELLPAGATLAAHGEAAASLDLPMAPQRIVSWDETVVTPGDLRVAGGTPEEWLGRVNRDPSLAPQGFRVRLSLVLPGGSAAGIDLVRVRLYKEGDPAVRLSQDLVPTAGSWELPVEMTLAELAGSGGQPPSFSLEYDTLAGGGAISLAQRLEVRPAVAEAPLLVLVETPGATYTVEPEEAGGGRQEGLDREAAAALVQRLREEGLRWRIYARAAATEEPQGPGTAEPTGTGGGATTTEPTGPAVAVVTDLLAEPLAAGRLDSVFVVLQADEDGATRSSFVCDRQSHGRIEWRPASGTIPPFRYKITYLYPGSPPRVVEGTEANLTLILDPPEAT